MTTLRTEVGRPPIRTAVDGDGLMRPSQPEGPRMGHPTLSFEEARQRNEEIVAYSNQHPEVTSTSLAVKHGLSRETIRQILERARRQTERNQRLAAKAQHWGFRGH